MSTMDFNPRSPHRERLSGRDRKLQCIGKFQSTLPSQGATDSCQCQFFFVFYFNPRSPHRERLCTVGSMRNLLRFQSTLPSQGATAYAQQYFKTLGFQSTLPSQGATASGMTRGQSTGISIHAPLTGSDKRIYDAYKLYRNFNPRSPHRERLVRGGEVDTAWNFNPRSPHRERQTDVTNQFNSYKISIHAPLTGSDIYFRGFGLYEQNFNPRSPHRERL